MEQDYSQYTREDHETWSFLINRSERVLPIVNKAFKDGLKLLDLPNTHIPHFDKMNERLLSLTGWHYEAADEPVTNAEFMVALSEKTFLATTKIRGADELDFCRLPDIFHDVFGHAALLTYAPFCTFLESIGKLCVKHISNETIVRFLANIYWYTAEVGLVMEEDTLKCYGGSIISSFSEIERVYSAESRKVPFSFSSAGNTAYNSYAVNDVYFVTDDVRELDNGIHEMSLLVDKQIRFELALKSVL